MQTDVELVWQAIAATVRDLEDRGRKPQGAAVKSRAQVALGRKIVEQDYGFKSFKELARAAEAAGLIRFGPEAGADFTLSSVSGEFAVLADVVTHLIERGGNPVGANVKPLLVDALGGTFSEATLGYRSFKEFALAAQASGFVTVIDEPSRPDFRLSPSDPEARQRSPHLSDDGDGLGSLDTTFEWLRDVVIDQNQQGRSPFASAIKDRLKRRHPEFDERKLGYSKFSAFLQAAEYEGYVSLQGRSGHGRTVIDVFPPTGDGLVFADIKFGYASAGAESVRDPGLVLEGFYDFKNVVSAILGGSEYLILGHKGSGKSSIGEHLVQRADSDPSLFVDFVDLKDFPYGTLSQLPDDDSSQQVLRLSWRWLLLLRAFQSLLNDAGADRLDGSGALRLAKELEKQGMLPSKSLSEMSLNSVSLALKGGLPQLFEGSVGGEFSTRQVQLTDAVRKLERVVSQFRTPNRHIHVIDGLDELITPDERQYASLSALLGEVQSVNDIYYRVGGAAKMVLLCREDLFERLTSPNKNQLRQNFSVALRWSSEWEGTDGSELGGLIRQRARISGYIGDDPIRDLLPLKASVDDGQSDMWPFLISHTRQTPRDLIALLTKIQRRSGLASATSTHVQKGLNDYSSEYFIPELKDELQGYLQPGHIDQVFGLLSGLRKRTFLAREVVQLADDRGLDIEVNHFLQILFECSAIGHDRSRDGRLHEFRYMNPNLAINPREPLIVHRGAWWGLSLLQ